MERDIPCFNLMGGCTQTPHCTFTCAALGQQEADVKSPAVEQPEKPTPKAD